MAQSDFTIEIDESDYLKLQSMLTNLSNVDKRSEIKSALNKGISLIFQKSRSNLMTEVYNKPAPWKRTGNLKKSAAKKILMNKQSAYSGYRRNSKKGSGIPGGNHSHLVDRGHGGPRPAKPHPFQTPAVQSEGPKALNILIVEIYNSINKIMNR